MKLLNLASKLLAILSIFGGTTYIIIKRYATETTQEFVETTTTIGLFPTLLIGAIILAGLLYATNGLKQNLRESKFGWLAIIFFGIVLGIITFGIWFIFNSMLISAQSNIDMYLEAMEYHKQTVYYMLYPIAFGISLGGISKLLEIDLVQKFFTNLIK